MTSTGDRMTLLSVILSFRNEESVIPELIRRLTLSLDRCNADHELIFVNDASTDCSLELLKEFSQNDPRIKIINMSRRFGVGECLLAGMEWSSGDAVIYLDCDLQDPPELIPEMVTKWRDGADVVYTVRTRRLGERPLKMLITTLAYRIIAALSEINLPINSGDFRLLSRQVVDELLHLKESDPFIRGLTAWAGFRQVPVYYERKPRSAGAGHFPVFTSLGPLKALLSGLTSLSMVPLYVIFFIGLIACFISGIALVILAVFAAFGNAAIGVSALVFMFVMLWGVSMVALGTVAFYVSRIYKDVRGRPRYIVSNAIGFNDEKN